MDNVSQSTLLSLPALLMPSSMVFHAPAIVVSIKLQATHVDNALKEPPGMEILVVLKLPEPALQATFSTKIQINANLQHPHAEITLTSTEHAASVSLATTLSTEFVSNVHLDMPLTDPNAQKHHLISSALPTKF